jgi:hypothetical protein
MGLPGEQADARASKPTAEPTRASKPTAGPGQETTHEDPLSSMVL